ncbi:LysE family translocator [Staphylococcus casei]|uniref:LysE family translocator n=1 Tax=Staphylococcus casei TaxID=201828 RepID=A0ABZ2WG03_9STAP|nr:lysine transporter LysE [Staphylococcus succinus]PTI39566.1 LysE family translocator [Staphylococcus succinus]
MNILSFLLYTFLVTVTPGPTNIDILNTIKHRGTAAGIKYTYGAVIAIFLLLIISTMLNMMLSQFIPSILLVMKIIGTGYMLYLVYTIFKSQQDSQFHKNTGTFRAGFNLQFLNPKVITFSLTVMPTFILNSYHSIYIIYTFVIIITGIGFFSLSIWVLCGTLLQRFLQNHDLLVKCTMAIFLIYAAIIIWI